MKELRVKTRTKLLTTVATILAACAMAVTPMIASAADGDIDTHVFVAHTTCLTPVQLVGGGGTFCLTTDVCVSFSSDDIPPVGICTLSASGSYTNTVCGTGNVSGTATSAEADGSVDTVGFSLTLVAGLGVITGGAVGVVDLQPSGLGTDGHTCATSFDVEGAAVFQ
jgi:hypothetical protein